MSDKPVLHCLVGFLSPLFGLVNQPRVMTLEEAVEYARYGFYVMVDPFDASDLARWEQIERSKVTRRRWLDV
jgi:hypothetical protein